MFDFQNDANKYLRGPINSEKYMDLSSIPLNITKARGRSYLMWRARVSQPHSIFVYNKILLNSQIHCRENLGIFFVETMREYLVLIIHIL